MLSFRLLFRPIHIPRDEPYDSWFEYIVAMSINVYNCVQCVQYKFRTLLHFGRVGEFVVVPSITDGHETLSVPFAVGIGAVPTQRTGVLEQLVAVKLCENDLFMLRLIDMQLRLK